MKGRLDAHQIELYKIALLESLCRIHGITKEKMDSLVDNIRKED